MKMAQTSLMKESKVYFYMMRGRRFWTKEGEEAIVARFISGASMGLIAKEFQTTLGSIAGLLSRAREHKILAPPTARKPKQVVDKKENKIKQIKLDPITIRLSKIKQTEPIKRIRLKIVENHTVTFEDLKDNQCHYPLGDPKRSDFRFCGKPKMPDTPYCKEHHVICTMHVRASPKFVVRSWHR